MAIAEYAFTHSFTLTGNSTLDPLMILIAEQIDAELGRDSGIKEPEEALESDTTAAPELLPEQQPEPKSIPAPRPVSTPESEPTTTVNPTAEPTNYQSHEVFKEIVPIPISAPKPIAANRILCPRPTAKNRYKQYNSTTVKRYNALRISKMLARPQRLRQKRV